ncbi:hypothetical protein ACIHAR_28490 [Streptomyces sp. NPDC052016]|uniref:hypothetical protein n=1 Tax=Streptomyces sp. NPDC052016 TaxID=3365680 RepID=UPI0037CCE4FA
MDTTPSTHGPLRKRIRAGGHDAFGELFDAYARSVYNFVLVGDLARESLIPPAQAAALYRAAAGISGVFVIDDAVDAAGRHGVAVARIDDGERHEPIFDRKTKEFLGEREVAVADLTSGPEKGDVTARTAVLERTVVDKRGERPQRVRDPLPRVQAGVMTGSIEQGTSQTHGNTRILHFLVRLPRSMETVWPTIATAEGLAAWFGPVDVLEPRLGGVFGVPGLGGGRVTAWDVDRVAEYTLEGGRMRFHLERGGDDASVLRFTHEFQGEGESEAGWRTRFERLIENLEGSADGP